MSGPDPVEIAAAALMHGALVPPETAWRGAESAVAGLRDANLLVTGTEVCRAHLLPVVATGEPRHLTADGKLAGECPELETISNESFPAVRAITRKGPEHG